MKLKSFPVVLAVLATSATTQAVTVTHLEDSVTRTWFSVIWGELPSAPLAFLKNGPLSDAGAVDNGGSVHVDAIHPFFNDGFNINFAPASRLFAGATVDGFEGVQILPLTGEPFGVQVVYGEPIPVAGVPEAGATAGLLSLGWGLIVWCARRLTRGESIQ